METKICTGCKIDKPLVDFGLKRGKLNTRCRKCISEYYKNYYHASPERKRVQIARSSVNTRKYIEANKAIVWEYLSSHPCDCGESDPIVLEFDHDDPALKVNNVTDMFAWSRSKLEEEMAKCTVRCANCHRRRTVEQFGTWKSNYPAVYPLADNELKG